MDLRGEVADVVAHCFDERPAGVAVSRSIEARELLGDPVGQLLLGDVVNEKVAGLRDRLGERRVPLDPVADEREDGGRRRSFQVRRELLDVCRLPRLDTVDHDEACVPAEQTERVASRNRVLSRRLGGVKLLGRVLTDPRPQAL
jgi:hypothetical protein